MFLCLCCALTVVSTQAWGQATGRSKGAKTPAVSSQPGPFEPGAVSVSEPEPKSLETPAAPIILEPSSRKHENGGLLGQLLQTGPKHGGRTKIKYRFLQLFNPLAPIEYKVSHRTDRIMGNPDPYRFMTRARQLETPGIILFSRTLLLGREKPLKTRPAGTGTQGRR